MISKEKLDSWYTPKDQVIEYDGRYCSSNCRKNGCIHLDIWAEHLVRIFDRVKFDVREKIINYLNKENFDDLVTEIYDTHCSDCLGTGEATSWHRGEETGWNHVSDGTTSCHCQAENHD